MLSALTFLFNLIFSLFQSKRELLVKIALRQKEIEIVRLITSSTGCAD